MRALLFGAGGQIGSALRTLLSGSADLVIAERSSHSSLSGDLAFAAGLRETIRTVKPDIIFNAAGYTDVDRAESEPAIARTINSLAPAAMASQAAASGAWLVHFSSDYVFDGSGSIPWAETSVPSPLNVYGHSKLAGEAAIYESGCQHLVLRTSWVFGSVADNFPTTILRLAREQSKLNVVDDQVGAPTSAHLLARFTVQAAEAALACNLAPGLYHLCSSGETSRLGYARRILERAAGRGELLRVPAREVRAISTSAWRSPAARPLNSRLDTSKFRRSLGVVLPTWQQEVDGWTATRLRDD